MNEHTRERLVAQPIISALSEEGLLDVETMPWSEIARAIDVVEKAVEELVWIGDVTINESIERD